MPELPEVEVIRTGLQRRLPGRVIDSVRVRKHLVLAVPETELVSRLPGQSVQAVSRRGKFLLLELDRDCLVVHLGMTGQLTFWNREEPDSDRFVVHPTTGLQRIRQHAVDAHTHVTLWFRDGDGLHYRDIRQFGRIRLAPRDEVHDIEPLCSLGPEPFGPDYRLDAFEAFLKGRRRPIKSTLLDQSFVAGVGNIYADEALFEAGVRPTRMAGRLTASERRRLFDAIPTVLRKGIEFGGTSMRDYVDSDGARGSHQEELLVYGREGKPCRVCQTPIRRLVLSQRSSHYCPTCQNRARSAR